MLILQVLIINLAHEGENSLESRNKQVEKIETQMQLYGYRSKDHKEARLSDRFDHVFYAGDFNYRIGQPRNYVDQKLNEMDLQDLLKYDELLTGLRDKRIFQGFMEAPITFQPTYKFDVEKIESPSIFGFEPNLNQYDTSKKQRIPSWTDRILYKSRKQFSIFGMAMIFFPQIKYKIYNSCMDLHVSDHKPGILSLKSSWIV